VPFNNNGEMELQGLVGIEGDAVFTASPPELFADAGGQDGLILTFEPYEAGVFEGTVILQTSDPLYPEVTINVIGEGQERNRNGGSDDPDDNGLVDDGTGVLYSGCLCNSGASLSPGGVLPWVIGLPLLGLRRRRRNG